MSEKKGMTYHPLANIFPLMSEEEFKDHCRDLQRNGLRRPIVLLGGMILEGRNRYNACCATGIEPLYVDYDGTDPMALVCSENLYRRHLTATQKAAIAAEVAERLEELARNTKTPVGRLKAQTAAAKQTGASPRSTRLAADVRRQAVPAVHEAVKDGKIALAVAKDIAALPTSDQGPALQAAVTPKPSGTQIADPRQWAKWENAFGKLKRQTDELQAHSPSKDFSAFIHERLNQAHEAFIEWRTRK